MIKTIAACARSISARGKIDHINAQWYHSSVSSKKGLIGFGDSTTIAAQSRNTAQSCGFFNRAPVLVARMGGRKACRFNSSAVVPVRQPVRAASPFGDGGSCFRPQLEPIMAQSPSMGATALVTSDIFVNIEPNFFCRYYGTSAQLVAEGLIPADFQWPLRNRRACFKDARFDYWLERKRVPGTKGPMSGWIDGDYWVLDVSPKGQRADWMTREIQIKQRELADLKKHGSPEWQKSWSGAYAARQDAKYMAFRTQLLGDMTPRKRGRPVKTTATQTQGAANV